MDTVADLLPALGLRITAGPVESRGLGDDDLAALEDLAARGVHALVVEGLEPFRRSIGLPPTTHSPGAAGTTASETP